MRTPERPVSFRRQGRELAPGLPGPREAAQPEAFGNAEIALTFDDNRLTSMLFGQYDQNIAKLERRLGVMATANGNHVSLKGAPDACEHARRVLELLYEQGRQGRRIELGDIDGAIEETATQGLLFPKDQGGERPSGFVEIRTRKRGLVRARTAAQDAYLRALGSHELVFAEGPAGTGKTWLAVGHAITLLERGLVERLVLTRPAVEAGERLGFLPGDMREKIDPYLRPVYDALHDFMEGRMVERGLQTGMIEIAPLAFMRGRTLTNAVVLLDEAQNTTSMQMKMFLTRLGEGSRMIVNGDSSQTDLPAGQKSGLAEAVRLLAGVPGIAHVRFREADVVRHDLVRRIVAAYEAQSRPPTQAPSEAPS